MRRVGQLPVSGSIPFHFLSRAHKKGLVILALRVRRDRCRAESTLEVKSYDNDNERQRMKSVLAIFQYKAINV